MTTSQSIHKLLGVYHKKLYINFSSKRNAYQTAI